MSLPVMTIVGRLTRDPELRFTPSGKPVCSFGLAASDRTKDGDAWVDRDTTFFDVVVWDRLGENVADQCHKGEEVVVVGKMRQREYENKEGRTVRVFEVVASHVGASLRWAPVGAGAAAPRAGGVDEGDAPPF